VNLYLKHPHGMSVFRIRLLDPPLPISDSADEDGRVSVDAARYATVPAFMASKRELEISRDPPEKLFLTHQLTIPNGNYMVRRECKIHGMSFNTDDGSQPCTHTLWPLSSFLDVPNHRLGHVDEEKWRVLVFTPDSIYWVDEPIMADDPVTIEPGIFATATKVR
jgi:hypothetical protein